MSRYLFTPTSLFRTHNVTHTRGHASRRVQGGYQCTFSREGSAHGIPLSLSLSSIRSLEKTQYMVLSVSLSFSPIFYSLSLPISLPFSPILTLEETQ